MFGFGSPLTGIATNAANQASNTGANYGSQASSVNAQLFPFLTRELNNPQGFTQQQQTSMLDQAEAGTGGSTAGLTTAANLEAARNRNSGSFSGALDDAARTADKTLAGNAEGIAAKNANLQQSQQQNAANGLSNMYGMDTNAQLKAMGLISPDVQAGVSAERAPWEDLSNFMSGAGNLATGYANVLKATNGSGNN